MREVGDEVVVVASPENVRRALDDLAPFPEPHVRLAWRGRARVRGLFDGSHDLSAYSLDDGSMWVVGRRRFRGLMEPLVGAEYYRRALHELQLVLAAVKVRAELLEAAGRDGRPPPEEERVESLPRAA
jgi:hypothetical protein